MAPERSRTLVQRARQRVGALLPRLPVRPTSSAGGPPRGLGCGVHRASVVTDEDPQERRRLQVVVPGVLSEPAWALPCLPPGLEAWPTVGDVVWVAFERGDVQAPVWLGVLPGRGAGPHG